MNFQAVTEFLDQVEAQFGVPACECVVYQDHKPIYRHCAGFLDAARTIPLSGGQWYWIYSCSKVMTMTAVMQLLEQGLVDLDGPVSRYLPECANLTVRDGDAVRPARTTLTLRCLMTMTGGFTYDLTQPSLMKTKDATKNHASTRQMIQALCREPLAFDPGRRCCYSLCHDVAAAVVEAVSGQRFSDYVLTHIAAPLGITGLTFRPGEKELANMPNQLCFQAQTRRLVPYGKGNDYRLTDNYDSGGAGICCRAEDYILFLDALACGGVGQNGERILTPESIALLTTNQLQGVPLEDYHTCVMPASEGYGLGVRIHMVDNGTVPVGEFGWNGAAGATAVMEPSRRLSVFYVQHVLSYPANQDLHAALLQRVYQAVDAK